MRRVLFFVLLTVVAVWSHASALERHIHASAGATSAQQLPIFAAKDLGLFEKYGLDVEPLVITGGSTLLQALVGRSIHSANGDFCDLSQQESVQFHRPKRNPHAIGSQRKESRDRQFWRRKPIQRSHGVEGLGFVPGLGSTGSVGQ